tara:strand:- start:310 stop:414 length:105 start_codon:yes stop_codon:yes gene_type:complete
MIDRTTLIILVAGQNCGQDKADDYKIVNYNSEGD